MERSGGAKQERRLPATAWSPKPATVRPFTTIQACQVLMAAVVLSVVGNWCQHTISGQS